ncbi:MAG TPA: hypothetical protein VK021_05055 [Flavobacteriaceae bacterium]|nr:hypothetical protein [Flavobacteriaceae bacterium]
MKFKYLTVVLIVVGAILLIFSSGIEPAADGRQTIWFKIVGLILLMAGIYRASRVKPEQNNEIDEDQEG